MGLDLLSTFVLNRYIFVVFLQKKIQTLLLKTSSRGCVRTLTLPVVLALCKMILLADHSEPELETVWVVLWCITVAVLLLIIVCIECSPPRRFVRWLYHLLNKCVISLLRLIFVSHLVSTYVGTLHIPYNMYIYFYIRQPTSYDKQTIIYFKYKTDQ